MYEGQARWLHSNQVTSWKRKTMVLMLEWWVDVNCRLLSFQCSKSRKETYHYGFLFCCSLGCHVDKKEQQIKQENLLHIPHSSYLIPDEYKHLFCITERELKQEQIKMTDSYTDELFCMPFKKLVFSISRLICDVERFREESEEEMTKQGMWVCYTKTHKLTKLKEVTEEHKKEILEKYYDPHHKKIEEEVENILKQNKKCLIIDCHSFPSKALPYELYKNDKRPEICLGTDNFHTEKNTILYLKNGFQKLGYSVGINEPFKGTVIKSTSL